MTVAVLVQRFAGRLRFPQLFLATLALFLIDLVVPDLVPFADELLLGLTTLLLGSWKKAGPAPEAKPPIKDVTPRG